MDEVVVIDLTLQPIEVVMAELEAPVCIEMGQSLIEIVPVEQPAVVLSIGIPGPPGPAGATFDPVWPLTKPDITDITYDADENIERIDYEDGTFKLFSFDAEGLLTQVSGENIGGDTITRTFTYDGEDRLVSNDTVVS